jgi:hypothetical protein
MPARGEPFAWSLLPATRKPSALPPQDHSSLSLEEVRKRLGSESSEFFVAGAFEGSRLAGMAGFHREKGLKLRHKGRVWGVYVTPTSLPVARIEVIRLGAAGTAGGREMDR